MEEICTELSAFLCNAGMGGYKIFYEEELTECLPEDMRNRETLEAALKNLSSGGHIDVKYARGNAFCIASLKKYEVEKPETAPEAVPSAPLEAQAALPKRAYAFLSLFAFLGGAAGGCVAAAIAAVI